MSYDLNYIRNLNFNLIIHVKYVRVYVSKIVEEKLYISGRNVVDVYCGSWASHGSGRSSKMIMQL